VTRLTVHILTFFIAIAVWQSSLTKQNELLGQEGGIKLRVLAVADPEGFDARNGNKVISDAYGIVEAFLKQVPKSDLTSVVIAEKNPLSPDTILTSIRNMQVNRNDAFVFFYSGHGAYDPRKKEYYFQLSGQGRNGQDYLLRKQVKEALLDKGARLTVVISDCCSADVLLPEDRSYEVTSRAIEIASWSPLCKKLMKETSGYVDFTSSTPPELSWTDKSRNGSIFSLELNSVLKFRRDQSLSWQEVFRYAKEATIEVARKRGKEQTPKMLQYDVGEAGPGGIRNGLRFGAEAQSLSGGGVVIRQVIPNFSADKAGLEAGDELHAWNGRRINSIGDFSRFVDSSSGEVTITVRNVRDGEWYDIRVNLP